jgi:hypothetical protein
VIANRRIVLCALTGLVFAGLAAAQTGHPAKGSWLGYYGPSEADQTRIRLLLDWEDRTITGVINPGRNAVPIESADLDVSTWTLRIEAEMPAPSGRSEHLVMTGQLENLGSWTNRVYAGTYRLGEETGEFRVSRN